MIYVGRELNVTLQQYEGKRLVAVFFLKIHDDVYRCYFVGFASRLTDSYLGNHGCSYSGEERHGVNTVEGG